MTALAASCPVSSMQSVTVGSGAAGAGTKRKLEATAAAASGTSPSSAVVAAPRVNAGAASQEAFNESYLKFYYKHLFPFNLMFRWFAYGNGACPSSPRFTLPSRLDLDFAGNLLLCTVETGGFLRSTLSG